MKKILLLAMSALVGLSSAFAETKYIKGEVVKDPSQISDDKIYFLHAKFKTTREREGYITGINSQANDNDSKYARYAGAYSIDISTTGIVNINYLWRLVKVTEGNYTGGYKVQCIGAKGTDGNPRWLSKYGARAEGKNNIKSTSSETHDNTAIYYLEVPGAGLINSYSTVEKPRFWFRLANGYFEGDTNRPVCLMSNGPDNDLNGNGAENVAYWEYNDSPDGYLQILIEEAIAIDDQTPVSITVNFPGVNCWPAFTETLNIYKDQDVTRFIKEKLEQLGGMANPTITSDSGSDLTVTESNKSFTVTGTWDRELIANHVYRVMLKPNDSPAAMRYDAINGYINTTSDYDNTDISTFNRLVPERLWVFRPVEGKTGVYTLHTLADPDKGVYIADATDNTNYAIATLSDEEHPATEFTVGKTNWSSALKGDFYLSYGADNGNYLNDRGIPGSGGTGGYVCQWRNSAAQSGVGSAFRLYPITDDDLENLKVAPGTAPTEANLSQAIIDFNATNVDAALRRIRYINANNADLFGPYVGQWDNEAGDAKQLYDRAVEISNGAEADDEEKQAIVSGLDPMNLTFKELIPNRFYRFKNKISGKYISSISSHTIGTRAYMDLTDDGDRSNTVFLYHQEGEGDAAANTLVCFDNGLVMPSFNGTNWLPVLKTDADAAQGTKLTYQNNGRYIIHVSGTGDSHRHLYGAGDTQGNSPIVDCAGEETGDKYQWYVEEVTKLPIPFYNVFYNENNNSAYSYDGWASVYSPVALEVPSTYEHLTAYTCQFDGEDYSHSTDINHVVATLIKPNDDDKVIIPANQPVLLFYDGELTPSENDNIYESLIGRNEIYYINLNIAQDQSTTTGVSNIKGSCFAQAQAEGKEYYTLHATHSNNFREISNYKNGYFEYIPGFKAYIENDPDGVDQYPIYLTNINALAPDHGQSGFKIEKDQTNNFWHVTIITPDENCKVFYKHTTAQSETRRVIRRANEEEAGSTEGYSKANSVGNEHTFDVPSAGRVDYYTYHEPTQTQSAPRTFTAYSDGSTVGIVEVNAGTERAVECYDLQGRKLAAPAKGLNIINGKKLIVR